MVRLPNKVQNIPPSTGSGREAKSAVNLPMVPRRSMMPAPYCITLLLPTCTERLAAGDGARPTPAEPGPPPLRYLGDAQDPDVGAGGGGAVAGSQQSRDDAGDAFGENAPGERRERAGVRTALYRRIPARSPGMPRGGGTG